MVTHCTHFDCYNNVLYNVYIKINMVNIIITILPRTTKTHLLYELS